MKLTGEQVIKMLLALGEGERVLVDGVDWTSIEDKFAVPADSLGALAAEGDATVFARREDLDNHFDAGSSYEVSR